MRRRRVGHDPAGLRGVINDAVAIYFLNAALAAAFVSRWCAGSAVEISDGPFRVRNDQNGAQGCPRTAPRHLRITENSAR